MKRVRLAGFQLADVNAGGGQSVERKIVFGTPEWLAAVRHAAVEAERLGLEMTVFSSAGWRLIGPKLIQLHWPLIGRANGSVIFVPSTVYKISARLNRYRPHENRPMRR